LSKQTNKEQVKLNNRETKNDWNPLHHIKPQQNKTRCQQQKKPQKIFKHMEAEQHTVEKPRMTEVMSEEIKKVPGIQ
jgi:hypothetical protein